MTFTLNVKDSLTVIFLGIAAIYLIVWAARVQDAEGNMDNSYRWEWIVTLTMVLLTLILWVK